MYKAKLFPQPARLQLNPVSNNARFSYICPNASIFVSVSNWDGAYH